jgi:hypothetical protein
MTSTSERTYRPRSNPQQPTHRAPAVSPHPPAPAWWPLSGPFLRVIRVFGLECPFEENPSRMRLRWHLLIHPLELIEEGDKPLNCLRYQVFVGQSVSWGRRCGKVVAGDRRPCDNWRRGGIWGVTREVLAKEVVIGPCKRGASTVSRMSSTRKDYSPLTSWVHWTSSALKQAASPSLGPLVKIDFLVKKYPKALLRCPKQLSR